MASYLSNPDELKRELQEIVDKGRKIETSSCTDPSIRSNLLLEAIHEELVLRNDLFVYAITKGVFTK